MTTSSILKALQLGLGSEHVLVDTVENGAGAIALGSLKQFYSALSRPGAFKDGSVDPGDFISVDSDPFTFKGSEIMKR